MGNLVGLISLVKFGIHDFVLKRGAVYIARMLLLLYKVPVLLPESKRLLCLMKAHRFVSSPGLTVYIRKELANINAHAVDLMPKQSEQEIKWNASRFIVLKMPVFHGTGMEKGVILITFTATFNYFARFVDCQRLVKYFYIVLEPSWSGYCLPEIHFWQRFHNEPVVIQATEQKDFNYIKALATNLVPVDFGASDWVDDRIFRPIPGVEKKYDAVYVAGYTAIKRHHELLKAIKLMKDDAYKVALVCTPWGRHKKDIHRLIKYYAVGKQIDVYEGLSAPDVNSVLNASKVNILLSLKEGSNRSIFEGFFADVPGIVLRENIGVNKHYINSATGRLVESGKLVEALHFFRQEWENFTPRAWAEKNISPLVTTRKLETVLSGIATGKGEQWTCGLAVKVNSPEAVYRDDADKRVFMTPAEITDLFSTRVSSSETEAVLMQRSRELSELNKAQD